MEVWRLKLSHNRGVVDHNVFCILLEAKTHGLVSEVKSQVDCGGVNSGFGVRIVQVSVLPPTRSVIGSISFKYP